MRLYWLIYTPLVKIANIMRNLKILRMMPNPLPELEQLCYNIRVIIYQSFLSASPAGVLVQIHHTHTTSAKSINPPDLWFRYPWVRICMSTFFCHRRSSPHHRLTFILGTFVHRISSPLWMLSCASSLAPQLFPFVSCFYREKFLLKMCFFIKYSFYHIILPDYSIPK
jgi:hypothetical protein